MRVLNGLIGGLITAFAYVGILIIVGFLIEMLSRLAYKILGRYAFKTCIITGFLGTPIHELGHAIFCIIFGHKIVEMKLFIPQPTDGTLGYVSHSYNRKNLYQRMGNFFIGIGPILFGSAIIILLMFLLSRSSFNVFVALINFYIKEVPTDASYYFDFVYGGLHVFFTEFFKLANFKSWMWWVFIVISMLIGSHMSLSRPDIQGAATGIIFVVVLLFLPPLIASFFSSEALAVVLGYMMAGAIFMACIYILALLFSLVHVLFACILRPILNVTVRR